MCDFSGARDKSKWCLVDALHGSCTGDAGTMEGGIGVPQLNCPRLGGNCCFHVKEVRQRAFSELYKSYMGHSTVTGITFLPWYFPLSYCNLNDRKVVFFAYVLAKLNYQSMWHKRKKPKCLLFILWVQIMLWLLAL